MLTAIVKNLQSSERKFPLGACWEEIQSPTRSDTLKGHWDRGEKNPKYFTQQFNWSHSNAVATVVRSQDIPEHK